jgi:FixJ family two-component response regulator
VIVHTTKVVWRDDPPRPRLPASQASRPPVVQILIVDDDDSLRRALARTVRRAGHEVESFGSVEALMAHGLPSVDTCLVLDLDLPGRGGADFKRMLVESGQDLPTIFITAWDADEARDELAGIAPSTILHKPFQNEALLDAIGQACRHA